MRNWQSSRRLGSKMICRIMSRLVSCIRYRALRNGPWQPTSETRTYCQSSDPSGVAIAHATTEPWPPVAVKLVLSSIISFTPDFFLRQLNIHLGTQADLRSNTLCGHHLQQCGMFSTPEGRAIQVAIYGELVHQAICPRCSVL